MTSHAERKPPRSFFPTLLASIIALLGTINHHGWRTAAPGAVGPKPPRRSAAFITANNAMMAAQTAFADDQADMAAAVRKTAMDLLRAMESRVTTLQHEDKFDCEEYNDALEAVNEYAAACKTVEGFMGPYGPTGALSDKIFVGIKRTLGLDPTIQVSLHELIAKLETLQSLQKISAEEAAIMFAAIRKISVSFHKGSHAEFNAYSRAMVEFYRELKAAIPAPLGAAAPREPHFRINYLYELLLDYVDKGSHGRLVHDKLSALPAPTEDLASFELWLLSADAIVEEEAKRSTEDKPKEPKLAATVSHKGDGKSNKIGTGADKPKAPAMTGEEFNKIWPKDYCSTSMSGAFDCPYPHRHHDEKGYTPTHHGHNCSTAKTIVKQPGYINTSVNAAVLAALQG